MSRFAQLSDLKDKDVIEEMTIKVMKVLRPYDLSEHDHKYGWCRQKIEGEFEDGTKLSILIYHESMHLKPQCVGQVWRFRSMTDAKGESAGVEMNRWSGAHGDQWQIRVTQKADATRCSWKEPNGGKCPESDCTAPPPHESRKKASSLIEFMTEEECIELSEYVEEIERVRDRLMQDRRFATKVAIRIVKGLSEQRARPSEEKTAPKQRNDAGEAPERREDTTHLATSVEKQVIRDQSVLFVAANMRYAHMDGASDEQVADGHKACREFQRYGMTWEEVFDRLTRGREKEASIGLDYLRKRMPDRDDATIKEAICKGPDLLSAALEEVEKQNDPAR